jgi:general secretion pathway protein E
MVGEIRDVETAQIAIQASLTGHLVLSTVHTNSAAAAVTRLRDMGVEPFLLASTIACVLAQRLVRRLCASCKEGYRPDTAELSLLGLAPSLEATFFAAKGCEACGGTGYAGRIGIYEMMLVDDEVRRLIHDDARESDIAAYAARYADTLLGSGARQVAAGRTSSAEVLRVCRQSGDGDGGV